MPTPFPGMDPYLEHPDLWPDVHHRLIVTLADYLVPRLRPRYYVSIEQRTYRAGLTGLTFIGRPDAAVVAESGPAYFPAPAADAGPTRTVTVELPVPDTVRETYLEVRGVENGQVVTVLEVLSPTNKLPGEGRNHYERKRMAVLDSLTHLVEIDLLRAGPAMPMLGDDQGAHYRILISREWQRPRADLLPFTVRQPIPDFPLPLQRGEEELLVPLNALLHELYDRAGYDLRINYRREPEPPLGKEDAAWADVLLREQGLR